MPTQYISDWQVVDSADHAKVLTFDTFRTLEDAQAWVHFRASELEEATKHGAIGGVFFKESRTPARFIATSADALDYLGFGARIVQRVYVDGVLPALIIGLPQEHAGWLCARLHSGLVRHVGPFDSLEDAIAHAHQGL